MQGPDRTGLPKTIVPIARHRETPRTSAVATASLFVEWCHCNGEC